MNELNKFYQSLMQDVVAMQSGDDDGNTQEQVFTRICQEMLSEAGETENAYIAYDERDLGKKGSIRLMDMLFLIIMRMLIYLFQYLIISKKYVLFLNQRLIRLLKEYLIFS